MNTTWVLILVHALTPYDFEVTPLLQTDTIAQCYFQSTVADFDLSLEENSNRELLCIRVEEEE
tara:strand:+ start:130 stop:318 length:189 start_codon:yes stop_codon:yes gene_type:complete